MLGGFRVLRRFWKPPGLPLTKICLIILVFLFLIAQGWLAFQTWRLARQFQDLSLDLRQKIEQIQCNVNYSSSLLWTVKNQIDQLPYQINKRGN